MLTPEMLSVRVEPSSMQRVTWVVLRFAFFPRARAVGGDVPLNRLH